jgi:hypothetical protein
LKKLVISSLFVFLILFSSSNIFALSDNDVQELASTSSNFKQAEDRILKTWLNLPKEFRKQIQKNQIEWIKTTRDSEANALIAKGKSKAESYADVTNFRSDYLENLAQNYFNNRSTLHIEIICGDIEVLKNNDGDIVWPEKEESKICNERLGQAVSQPRGNQFGLTVTHGPDFDMPLTPTERSYDFPSVLEPKGYQSTATIEAKFSKDGVAQTISEPVTWTIADVQNSAPSWNRASNAKNGLVWGDTVDSTNSLNYRWTNDQVGGSFPNGATVKLTDVVGQRTVILKAETAISGVTYSATVAVTFGKGPLSVFSKPPSTGGRQWATAFGIKATKDETYDSPPPTHRGDFTDASTTFPAAEFCGGTVHSGSSDITVGGSGSYFYTADFTKGKNLNHWRAGDKANRYYSTTSKLPTFGQLVAVSAYDGDYHPNVKRKGAALAAGWADSSDSKEYYRYRTGQMGFGSNGSFSSDDVYLVYGEDFDSYYVTNGDPVVACVP